MVRTWYRGNWQHITKTTTWEKGISGLGQVCGGMGEEMRGLRSTNK